MKPVVIFWTKGGREIGLGHIRRSLAIAKYFRKKRKFSKICFITNKDNFVYRLIKKEGFNYFYSNNEIDHKVKFNRNTIIIFDTKDDISKEILSIKLKGAKVCLLDNLTNAKFYSDIIILPGAHFNDFSNHTQKKCFYGARYFPLSEEFLRNRKRAVYKKFTLLISFGGSDPNNLTKKVVRILRNYPEDIRIKVIIGPCFIHKEEIQKMSRETDRRFIFRQGDNVEKVTEDCQAALTAFGVSIYEFAYLGIPSIIIANYRDDQRWARILYRIQISKFLGYHKDVSAKKIHSAIDALRNDKILKKMSVKCKRLIDGKGTERIFNKICSLIYKRE